MSLLPPHWAELLAAFLERIKVLRYSPATLSSRQASLEVFFKWLEEVRAGEKITDIRDLTQQDVRDYQKYLMGRYRTRTTHTHIIALRRFFEHLEANDAVLFNPCQGVTLPRLEGRLPNVFSHDEVRRILNAPDTQTLKGIRDKAVLETFYSTGIRLEEMARLTVHDVDHTKGFLRVNRGKFCKDRVVPLGRKACDYIREYLQKVRAEWTKDNRDERALWLSWYWPHQPLKKQLISVMVRSYAKAAGIKRQASAHIWRHTCATHMVANGGNITYAQRLLGHRFMSTTERYIHVGIPDVKAAYAKAHPRTGTPTARQSKEASAPLKALPKKKRTAYRYKNK